MKSSKSILAIFFILSILIFLGWYFSDIVIYMLVALALAFLGKPLMQLLGRIHIKDWRFPSTLAAAITLIAILGSVVLLGYFLVPVVIREATAIANVDFDTIGEGFENWLNQLDPFLRKYGFIGRREHCSNLVTGWLQDEINKIDMSILVNNTFSMASSIVIGVFSVIFMTFFTLKDHNIFFRMIKEWIPTTYRKNFSNILGTTGKQLSSYFIGVFLDMLCVGVLECLLCLILHIPNAVLIGFIGGFLNIVPFVGPVLACILAIVISLIALIPASPESAMLMSTLIKVICIFAVTKMIDDFVLQPTIYGKRTHTHPLEIFIVILMAGSIGGVFAMIFAVPAYTLLRIIVKEFFGAYFFNEEDAANNTTEAQATETHPETTLTPDNQPIQK